MIIVQNTNYRTQKILAYYVLHKLHKFSYPIIKCRDCGEKIQNIPSKLCHEKPKDKYR